MYCPQCGGTNDDYAQTCATCGLDIDAYKRQWQRPDAQGTQPGTMPLQPAVAAAGAGSAGGTYQPYGAQPYGSYGQQAYGQSYGTPSYQQPYQPYQAQPAFVARPQVKAHLGWAIASLVLGFVPTGIAAVVFASRVNGKLAIGDYEGAIHSSKRAKLFIWISFAIGITLFILGFIAGLSGFAETTYYPY